MALASTAVTGRAVGWHGGGGGAGSHWVPLGNALGVPEWSCCAGDRVGRGVFVSCPAVWARGALQQTAWALPGLEM